MTPVTFRDITDLDGCHAVVRLQQAVWGEIFDLVPASLLLVSVKRGGILVGAFDGDDLVGFVWSMPGWRDGRPTHWSHMLGVADRARRRGLGLALKQAQRDRAKAAGAHLIEWTFDPLQAANAHLNLARLGCEVSIYLENVYGELDGPLHRGTPTDRLVAEWWLVPREVGSGPLPAARPTPAGARVTLIDTRPAGEWVEPLDVVAVPADAVLTLPVPARFSAMQQDALNLARAWRSVSRQAFQASFAAGYRVVGFELDRERGGGRYVLSRGRG